MPWIPKRKRRKLSFFFQTKVLTLKIAEPDARKEEDSDAELETEAPPSRKFPPYKLFVLSLNRARSHHSAGHPHEGRTPPPPLHS